ncbi:hypothetical protein B0J14DRAFT_660345 [Halenospora varia]|nr:hypothetical protein B0J14DRAFT_660345 [Halenospora varia]
MKFSLPTTLIALLVATPALACVRSEGTITTHPIMGTTIGATLTDNGLKVCDGERTDADGKWVYKCVGKATMTITKFGTHAWYKNIDGATYEWDQNVKVDRYGCVGACEDRKGACMSCTDKSWDVKLYC